MNNNNGIELVNGGNNDQEPPTINSATVCSMGSTLVTIVVTAPSTPAASNFRLEFFLNTTNRNPITEGETFIGAIASVPSGQMVTQSFTAPTIVSPGQFVSATATNLNGTGGIPGDTSEFSLNTAFAPIPGGPIITSFNASATTISAGDPVTFTVTFTDVNPGPYTASWSDGTAQTNVTSPFEYVVHPTVTTTYTVTITDSVGCNDTSASITIAVSPSVLPPDNVQGRARRNIFLTQIDLVNVITWTAPTGGAQPTSYKIYRDPALTDLVATIPATAPLVYCDHNRTPCVIYNYYLVSVDENGNVSTPVHITVTS